MNTIVFITLFTMFMFLVLSTASCYLRPKKLDLANWHEWAQRASKLEISKTIEHISYVEKDSDFASCIINILKLYFNRLDRFYLPLEFRCCKSAKGMLERASKRKLRKIARSNNAGYVLATPRYIWDGRGLFLGIKVAENLIICPPIMGSYSASECCDLSNMHRRRLLSSEDVKLVAKNINLISKMFDEIYDYKIINHIFWIEDTSKGSLAVSFDSEQSFYSDTRYLNACYICKY